MTLFIAMFSTLLAAKIVLARIAPQAIDPVTRIVGFFVPATGMARNFHGIIEALQTYGLTTEHER